MHGQQNIKTKIHLRYVKVRQHWRQYLITSLYALKSKHTVIRFAIGVNLFDNLEVSFF